MAFVSLLLEVFSFRPIFLKILVKILHASRRVHHVKRANAKGIGPNTDFPYNHKTCVIL